jgi:hypothetical protein
MTQDSSRIPERWLDILTGYVELTVLAGAGLALLTAIVG